MFHEVLDKASDEMLVSNLPVEERVQSVSDNGPICNL